MDRRGHSAAARAGGRGLAAALRAALLGAALAGGACGQTAGGGLFEAGSHVRLVAERVSAGEVRLFARLTNCTEVTITLTLGLTNAVASAPLPVTADAQGRTCFELVAIRAADRRQPWSYGGSYAWQFGRRGEPVNGAVAYELPYNEGAYRVTQADFGDQTHRAGSGSEHAIDWAMPVGTVVCAARAGTVVALRSDSTVGALSPAFGASSNFVVLRHEDGTFAEYGHLKRNGVFVWLGQSVKSRGVLGLSGSSGYSSGPHLHVSVFQNVDGRTRRSLPLQFRTLPGCVESLRVGQVY